MKQNHTCHLQNNFIVLTLTIQLLFRHPRGILRTATHWKHLKSICQVPSVLHPCQVSVTRAKTSTERAGSWQEATWTSSHPGRYQGSHSSHIERRCVTTSASIPLPKFRQGRKEVAKTSHKALGSPCTQAQGPLWEDTAGAGPGPHTQFTGQLCLKWETSLLTQLVFHKYSYSNIMAQWVFFESIWPIQTCAFKVFSELNSKSITTFHNHLLQASPFWPQGHQYNECAWTSTNYSLQLIA